MRQAAVSPIAVIRRALAHDRRAPLLVLAAVVGVWLLPRLVLGQDSIVTVHDNLDSDFAYRVFIGRDHRLFNPDATVTEFLGGLPRWDYPSALKLGSVLFWAFSPFLAYTVLEALVRAAAFWGMWLLLRDYVKPPRSAGLAVAAAFGLLPYYTVFDLSVAGQAFVLWGFLGLLTKEHVRPALAVCALFPFASVLPTSGLFVMALAGLLILAFAVRSRTFPTFAAGGLVVMAAGYSISDFEFLKGLFRHDFVSHRSVWLLSGNRTIGSSELLHFSKEMFLFGRYHAASLHTPILVVTALAIAALSIRREGKNARTLLLLVIVTGLVAMSAEAFRWTALAPLWSVVPGVQQVHMRFWWSLPVFWYGTLGFCARIWPNTGLPRGLLYAALTFQPVWVVAAPFGAEPELRRNYVALENRIAGRKPHDLSYREFVAASVFDQVRARMGQEASRRVVSVGLHPAVAALNGFSCADGYHDNYPLAYKDRFRRLIGGELRYDESLRRYFDEWGSRAYVFLRGKTMPAYGIRQGKYRILGRLALDESALHDLGIRWVVSALLIADPADERFLDYEGRFDDPGSAYAIHLYRVRD